ncbi:ABC transporter substrate-binding protein [Streptomyces sp. NPDC051738]|uniref:ABC transporter substrate-binding protein n=1 Tax=Streptomyces sp. NPDC051738 TaxID=3365672 RepID=UPI0037D391E9
MRRLTAPLVRGVLALGLLLAALGCGAPERERVTIMVPWSGTEFKAFHSVVEDFEKANPGIDVAPQVTRALTQQLDAAVAAETPPDLAVLPSVGAIAKYRGGALRPLGVDTSSFVDPFRLLAMDDGKVYAVPVKADVKSLVWYDRRLTPKPAGTWSALQGRPETWCLGLESPGATSGWPGADWIADILLAEEGVETYEDWVSRGGVRWNSAPVREAWETWWGVVEGGSKGATGRGFDEAAVELVGDRCSLGHGALSAMAFPPDLMEDERYTYALPSPRQALEVSADFVGKFTRDNPGADRLIAYLAGARAQQTWVNEPGYALSANRRVTTYDNPTQARIAGMLRSGHTLCFSAADAMDPDVSAAFYRAVMEYVNGEDLTKLLKALDRVQEHLGDSPRPTPLCGAPNQA